MLADRYVVAECSRYLDRRRTRPDDTESEEKYSNYVIEVATPAKPWMLRGKCLEQKKAIA
jgi:hypothetical protein